MNVLLFFSLFLQNLWAFKLVLIDSNLVLDKGVAATTATIVNDGENMIAIEAKPLVRTYNPDGTENLDMLAENLIIIPSQMIIAPNGEQVVSIRWTGGNDISIEQSYRLLIEYVSVSDDKLQGLSPEDQKASMNIIYRIAKSFYVTPKGAKANIVLNEAKKTQSEDGEMLHLSIENIGNKHQIINMLEVRFTTESDKTIVVSFDTKDFAAINMLALTKRDLDIPYPESLQNEIILKAEIIGLSE